MKFNNMRTTIDGIAFDSLAEGRRFNELCLLLDAGEISKLTVHPRYLLEEKFTDSSGVTHRAIYYEGDFEYIENGQTVCEDVKGKNHRTGKFVVTRIFQMKAKMFSRRYPNIKLVLVEA